VKLASISRLGRRAALALAGIVVAAGTAIWFFAIRETAIPNRTLRIGFEIAPPVQVKTDSGFSGLAVETVNEAARRAGIRLEWVETGTGSDEALERGLVDLWPVMADMPERRGRVHISRPWLNGGFNLVLRREAAVPTAGETSQIALTRIRNHSRWLLQEFPAAQAVVKPDAAAVLREVCTGSVVAGFLADRTALLALRELPAECGKVALRSERLPQLLGYMGVGSTFEAAGAADRIRDEIGNLYRDGTLAAMMAKYSYFGLESTWDTYVMMEAADQARRRVIWVSLLAIILGVMIWQSATLRQRKRSESALRESEARFRAIFQQAAVGVVQVSLDGVVTMVNQRCCEVLGYPQEELLGSKWLERISPEDRVAAEALMKQPEDGESLPLSIEIRCVRKQGGLVWVKVHSSFVNEDDNRAKYFVAVVEEITQKKQAEAAIEESERRFRSLADTAPVLLWVADRESGCTFFNQAYLQFTGLSHSGALGFGWTKRIHPEDREHCQENFRKAFDERRSYQIECRLQRADGEYRWVLATGVPRFEADGTFAGFVGSCTDTTEIKRVQQEALATQNLEGLGVMARGIAHDFNNLLGGILAMSELILLEVPKDSVAHSQVESIQKVAERAAQIVRQILAYAGADGALFAPVDLSSIVSEMLELMKITISKRARLTVSLPKNLPPALANATQMRQVVMNLVTNASEALDGKEGEIFVGIEEVPGAGAGGLRLTVKDTGCGMTEEVMGRIFVPFYTTKFAGRGLGLPAVQGIIRDHSGTLRVSSTPGNGSCFEVLLPCTTESAAVPAIAFSNGTERRVVGKVLVVDDEDELRTSIARLLRSRGYSVTEASDGLTGIAIFAEDPDAIDTVLLDLTLPGSSGPEVLQELRRLRPDIRVIIATAYSRDTVSKELGGTQRWEYLRKPYRISELAELLGTECLSSVRDGRSSKVSRHNT